MSATSSSSFMVEETGACVLLALHHRTFVVSLEVDLQAPLPAKSSTFVVWALTVPRREHSFADGFYSVAVPVPLGHVSSPLTPHRGTATAVLSLGRWELCAGSRVALLLAPPDCHAETVRCVLEQRVWPKRTAAQLTAAQHTLATSHATRWRLCGSQVVKADAAEEAEWRPLLHRRWYELKSYVREGTVVPYTASRGDVSDDDTASGSDAEGSEESEEAPQPLYAGDVKEAEAVSVNRQCVLWVDGGVGLHDEVKPFYRVYQPARQEKTTRVRRFPHRYADVIGEVPFGQCVEAFGRTVDPFTQEQYVLLYLPSGGAFASHIPTYELTFVEEGRYVWGWSKVAGTSGLPLLKEAQMDEAGDAGSTEGRSATTASGSLVAPSAGRPTTASRSAQSEVMELPEATFYTPVREGRAVRIRRRPTLTSATVREMEMNEVRAADALVTVPLRLPGDRSGTAVPHVFVQWQQGGYSLLRSEAESFLVPVMLSRVPRRFPIRTRSGEGNAGEEDMGEEETVVDLSRQRSRKRERMADSSEDGDESAAVQAMLHGGRKTSAAAAAAARADDSLLSPYSLPASLQEGLRNGVVRLEDLPPLNEEEEEEEEEEEDEEEETSEDSDFSDE